MKKLFGVIAFVLVSFATQAQYNTDAIWKALRVEGYVPAQYIKNASIPLGKIRGVTLKDSGQYLGIGLATTAGVNPKERLHVVGAIKVGTPTSYSTVTNNASTPVPNGGVGVIIYNPANNHFYGWIGTAWKQLDN